MNSIGNTPSPYPYPYPSLFPSTLSDLPPSLLVRLDADVISIETSRSSMELLTTFSEFAYPNQVGPGVYDVHAPRVPEKKEIVSLLQKALKVLAKSSQLWVIPDCGLKTRTWKEVDPALRTMVSAAHQLRDEIQSSV
jgi:5-methyltetrahydropteroyltriglutamate--homocysteine methyltransferase